MQYTGQVQRKLITGCLPLTILPCAFPCFCLTEIFSSQEEVQSITTGMYASDKFNNSLKSSKTKMKPDPKEDGREIPKRVQGTKTVLQNRDDQSSNEQRAAFRASAMETFQQMYCRKNFQVLLYINALCLNSSRPFGMLGAPCSLEILLSVGEVFAEKYRISGPFTI